MNMTNTIERIEFYVEGKMSELEKANFEQELAQDAELAAELENYHKAVVEIKNRGRLELKKKLLAIHREYTSKKTSWSHRHFKTILIAATLACVAIITSVIGYHTTVEKRTSKESLFSVYFTPYMNINATRGDDVDQITYLQKTAMYYYSIREYDNAIHNFEEIIKNSKVTDTEVLFYYGISCLGAKENIKAIEVFTKLSKDKNSIFFEQSKWYLSLSYLNNNDIPLTRQTLREIIKSKGNYTDKALDLLEKID